MTIKQFSSFRHDDERGALQSTLPEYFKAVCSKVVVSPKKGTWRGLHYQLRDVQTKVVTCVTGSIFGYVLDMRDGGTFGQIFGYSLRVGGSVLIPAGYAHGYLTTEKNSVVAYHCDAPHNPDAERSVRMIDPVLGARVMSKRDAEAPVYTQAERIVL